MNRGPENIFGKAPGRFDEAMAWRAVAGLPETALASCAAMDDAAFARFAILFNEVFGQGYGRRARVVIETEKSPCLSS